MFRTYFDPKRKLWSGPNIEPIFNPKISIGQAILAMLSRRPNMIGQISDDSGIKMTNRKIKINSIRVAENLKKIGCQQDDIIGIVAKNSHLLSSVVFGAFLIGTPVNTLDTTFDKEEIVRMFGITKPKLVFCDNDNYEVVKSSLEDLNNFSKIYTFGNKISGVAHVEELLQETGTENEFIPPSIGDGSKKIAAILCSSGTTGPPKGVCLSHACLLFKVSHLWKISENSAMLCFSSLYWLSGMGTLIFATMSNATRVITTDKFSPELMLQLIEKYKVTDISSPPAQMAMLLKSPAIKQANLETVKRYGCGGSVVPNRVKSEMLKYLPNGRILVGYGMTETGGIVSLKTSSGANNSVGQLSFGTQVKICDDDGKHLGVGELGEIWLRSTYIFLGYYGNDVARNNIIDENGWIHSGDIGYFDEDGDLCIVDRKKDILKYCNFHISPAEIENLILNHEGVAMVCVVGVPDEVMTDLPAAVVLKATGATVTEKDIYNLVKEKMSDFKQLRGGVYFVNNLPMTPSGKVIRKAVQQYAVDNYTAMAINNIDF